MKKQIRKEALMPAGVPRYIRIYDNGNTKEATFDRYTVVFTGRYLKNGVGYTYLGMSAMPTNPLGFCQHGFSDTLIDKPTYKHLGRKIKFLDLPVECQQIVVSDYMLLWEVF